MRREYEIRTVTSADDPVIGTILDGLNAHNDAQAPRRDHVQFVLAARQGDRLYGGALCTAVYDWVNVKLLWVSEDVRHQGWGAGIMRHIEQEATRRDCTGVHLDTYSFQALDFYLKIGYEIFGALPDHPRGHTRYYLQKKLMR